MAKNVLQVKIISPTQTIFDGEAYSISSVNSLGKFDILPFHANFITLVQKAPITLRVSRKSTTIQAPKKGGFMEELFGAETEELKYQFDLAIIFTKDNLVKIYTQIQPQF